MNMSSVASEICLLPCLTFARTASMIFSFGRSICGFRSGTQNLQRRPQPVVISTTPNVVRVSGKSRDELQAVIAHLKKQDFGLELSFGNFRS